MSALLPDVVRDAIEAKSTYAATESYGVVALVLLIVVMVVRELLRARESEAGTVAALSAAVPPLCIVVLLAVAVRMALLIE